MSELITRVVLTALGMFLGYFGSKVLEQKNGFMTKYINIMKEKKKNMQSHGIILAVALVLCVAVISVLLNLSVMIEAFIVGFLLGPLQLYFMILQNMSSNGKKHKMTSKK